MTLTQKWRNAAKKQLVELLSDMTYLAPKDCCNRLDIDWCADYLLYNDVIAPPCKVGDVVYSIGKLDGKVHRETVQYFNYDSEDQRFWFRTDGPGVFTSEHIGKWVFFTRKDAERALKERSNGTQ